MEDKSGVGRNAVSLPKGGGASLPSGEAFAVDQTRGTGYYAIPILVPPGPHVLKVQSCAGPGNTFGCRQHRYMQFVAQAGHEYIIDQGLFNRMSMRDATTGQLVVNSDDVLRELPAPQG